MERSLKRHGILDPGERELSIVDHDTTYSIRFNKLIYCSTAYFSSAHAFINFSWHANAAFAYSSKSYSFPFPSGPESNTS